MRYLVRINFMNKTVVVGMSGGVDSSVSAALLKEQGYNVIGMFMKNWEETDASGQCRSSYDYDDVRKVCDQIDIPYYAINFVTEYQEHVFAQFLADLKKGLTPNPDILCNREIKFKVFLEKAIELGADYLATGHYCQNQIINEYPSLVKGADPNKDQTYFLYAINGACLDKVLFPIGGMIKNQVRELARKYQLATAEKKDSTGICFIGKRDFRTFINQYIPAQPGDFLKLDGTRVGTHVGSIFYTLGQRKGLGIGGAGDAWFVVAKDIEKNIVFVEQGTDHPALYCQELFARDLNWIGVSPTQFPFTCNSKVRYRQIDLPCIIESIKDGKAHVTFPNPQRAVTPGQSIVFYESDHCLGGGIIC